MSRDIKFELVAKNMSGKILREVYTLDDLMGFEESYSVDIIAKRQYTGLKDKNGVEIYEGDNLRIQEYGVWQDYHVKDMVSFWLDLYAEFGGFEPDSNTMEVVGNAYQNPELLDKE